MRRGYQGLVNVCAKVDDSGKPISATICKSSGFNSLDFAALKTIKKWKFFISKNTESANKRIVHNVNVPINFVIN
jgi:TonB family protein